MKVVYTDEALENLDRILAFTSANYPMTLAALEKRLRTVVSRIGM